MKCAYKCSKCGCEMELGTTDRSLSYHDEDRWCVEALKARVEELEAEVLEKDVLMNALSGKGALIEIKEELVPFGVYVVHADGTPEKVGEVPEPVEYPWGKTCASSCPLNRPDEICSADLSEDFEDERKDIWYGPGPGCPRGRKETTNG